MRQKANTNAQSSEDIVKGIRRATRKLPVFPDDIFGSFVVAQPQITARSTWAHGRPQNS